MGTTKGSYTKTCNLCNHQYIVDTWEDDGRDWLGHQRGSGSYGDNDEGCPKCKNDVVLAGKIVEKQRAEKEEKLQFMKKELADFNIILINFRGSSTQYKYKALKETVFENGLYEVDVVKNKESKKVIVSFEGYYNIDLDKLKPYELVDLSNLKLFNGKNVTNEILNSDTEEFNKAVSEKKFDEVIFLANKLKALHDKKYTFYVNMFV